MTARVLPAFIVLGLLTGSALTQKPADPDRDRDGLSDFHEVHKYRTDPDKADSDGDGVPDGDWRERREYQYTIRTVVQVMRPVTPEFLSDDYQDARVLDETADYVELEVIHYPFNTVGETIGADPKWRQRAARMKRWTAPGPSSNWNKKMRRDLLAALKKDGIDAGRLDDKQLVQQASKWLCRHAKYNDSFTTFVTAFDDDGKPYLPEDLARAVPAGGDGGRMAEQWERDMLARGMFENGVRGSCTSSATYLNGCLRALGIPTRIVLTIPIVDSNDPRELELLKRGIRHRALRRDTVAAIEKIKGSWASHTFNEVFVDGRWRRLNYDRLGQDIRSPGMFGILTHVATFWDWADAEMPKTIGRRQTLRLYDDVFGNANPYSTIALRDEFGVHSEIQEEDAILQQVNVQSVAWGDLAPEKDVRDWFARRGEFGIVVRIDQVRNSTAAVGVLAEADQRVFLVADGHPTLKVGLQPGCAWGRDGDTADVVVLFGGADRRDLVAGVEYRVVFRNESEFAKLNDGDGFTITRPR